MAKGEQLILPGANEAKWFQYGNAWIDVRDWRASLRIVWNARRGAEMNVFSGHFVWHDRLAKVIRLNSSHSTIGTNHWEKSPANRSAHPFTRTMAVQRCATEADTLLCAGVFA